MDPREELLQIQKVISNNIKESIKDFQGKPSVQFKKYLNAYKGEFRSYRAKTDKHELISKILKTDIVFIGDYHTLDQSQRTVIKILREIVAKKSKISLIIEMVNEEFQHYLDSFMEGEITERDFLKKIDYSNNWGFPWKNYKPIFDFAKINGVRCVAANCGLTGNPDILNERDKCTAHIILREARRNPDNTIAVLYGDLHIAEEHLPKKTQNTLKKAGIKKNYAIIFQNSEALYWKLAEERKEHSADVVKLAPNKYCVLNTPPWIKLQTYLNWLERGGELLLSPQGDWSDEGSDPIDYYFQVSTLISTITSYLNFRKLDLSDFHIYTTEDIEFVDFMRKYMKGMENLSLKELDILRDEIIFNGICLIPSENVIYLSNLNINKVAEKASQFMSFKLSGFYPRLKRNADMEFFYSRILIETIGFIGSKIINFKRKCDRLNDFKKIIKDTKGKVLKGRLKDQKLIAQLVLKHKEFEKKVLSKNKRKPVFNKFFSEQPARIFLNLTKSLGFLIGNRIFLALIKGKINKNYIRRLFAYNPQRDIKPFDKYFEMVNLVKGIKEIYKSKFERF